MDISPLDDITFTEWLSSSMVLYFFVLSITAITLPLLTVSLFSLRNHRKNQCFPCLVAIICGNFVLLATICSAVLTEQLDFFHGPTICKLNTFLANTSSCFVHWTWVLLYLQRCFYVFFPMKARRQSRQKNQKVALMGVVIFACITQLWTPLLMTELRVQSSSGEALVCGGDDRLGPGLIQTIAVTECIVTFFIPFMLTVITDISVLVLRNPCQPHFDIISAEKIRGMNNSNSENTLKIVSQKNIIYAIRRKHRAIQRCLLMATLNLFLNLPNYSLQLLDEFVRFREGGTSLLRFYIRADAIAYVLYLLQFPLVPIYILFLKSDLAKSSAKHRKVDTITVKSPRESQNPILH